LNCANRRVGAGAGAITRVLPSRFIIGLTANIEPRLGIIVRSHCGGNVTHAHTPSRRILKEHEKYLLPNDLSSHFLSRDRIFIRSLLGVIFCKSLFSARGWEAIGLDEVVENVVFDHESGRSKLEMSYFTCMHEDDRINVIIEGHGKNSAAFSFRHYRYWVEKRLLVSSKDFVSHRIDADVA